MPSDAERAVAMLRYANYAKVAEALLVSRASVADWAKGKSVTPYRVRQLEQLLRPDLQAQQERPPAWAEGLEGRIADEVLTRLAAPDSPLVAQLEDRLEELGLLPSSESNGGSSAPRGAAGTARRP